MPLDLVHLRLLVALEIGPTSLKRGEGPLARRLQWLGANQGDEGEYSGGGMGGGRTNINRDVVDA